MKDRDFYSTLVAGFFAGMFFIFLLIILLPNSKVNQYNDAIEACEKSLPREVKCKISAVVE